MCEHCGCRGIEPIADLMDEHYEILDIAGDVRRLLAADDRHGAATKLAWLEQRLGEHVDREERGVFAALKSQDEFVEAVLELESEHVDFDAELDLLDIEHPTSTSACRVCCARCRNTSTRRTWASSRSPP